MFQFTQNEATAARRRIFFYAVSASDGYTAVTTGLSTSTSVYIVKNGSTPGTTPVGPTFTHIDAGLWYYEMTAAMVDTVGVLTVRISDALIRTVQLIGYVYLGDPLQVPTIPTFPANFSSLAITAGGIVSANTVQWNGTGVTGMPMPTYTQPSGFLATAFPTGTVASTTNITAGSVTTVTGNVNGNVTGSVGTLTAAAVQNIWDDLTTNNTVVGSVGKLIVDNLNATVSSRSTLAATDVWAASTRTLSAGTNIVLAKGTGITGFNDITATDVWAAGTRTLSAGTNIVLAKGTGITGFNDITAANVWDTNVSGYTTAGFAGTYQNKLDATVSSRSTLTAANVWDTATSGLTAVGSIGLKLNTNVDTTISSRMATFTYTTPPTATAIATQVWSEALPGSYTSGQAGFKLNAAGSAADPWATALPGVYGTGTAGNLIGNMPLNVWNVLASTVSVTGSMGLQLKTNVDTTISSRSSLSSANVADAVWNAVVHTYDGTTSNTTGTFGKAVLRSDQSSKNGDVSMYSISGTNGIDVDIHRIDNDATAAVNLKTLLMNTGTVTLGGQFDTAGNTAITKSVWNQLRSTASPASGVPAAGTFGYYLDQQVSTVGGGGGGLTAADVWDFDISGYAFGPQAGYACYQGFVEASLGKEFSEQVTTPAHLESQADYILNRNIAGGGNGTGATTDRTVRSALRALRNRSQVAGSTLTVYAENDNTPAWTAGVTQDAAAVPITGIDPA